MCEMLINETLMSRVLITECWETRCWETRCWETRCWRTRCWVLMNEMLMNEMFDEIWDDSVHYMSHSSSEKFTEFIFLSSKFFFFIVESIRLLDSIEIIIFNRVDVIFRHNTSRCKHVATNQIALRNSNRDRIQKCTRYWCFSNWLIIWNKIKLFENKSIDRESVVWWWSITK